MASPNPPDGTQAGAGNEPPATSAVVKNPSPTNRPTVRRLDSLKTRQLNPAIPADASTASTETTQAQGAAKRSLKYQPRLSTRRSKAEREALAAAESSRIFSESASSSSALAGKQSQRESQGRGRGRGNEGSTRGQRDGRGGRGRGGYMGENIQSGPFSSGLSVNQGKERTNLIRLSVSIKFC